MSSDLKEKNILFVENFTLVRFSGRRVLEEQGYIVEEAASAEEALLKVKKTSRHFDLIIVDIHLPDLDGLALLEKLKNMPAYAYYPVMILSIDKRISLVKKAVALGAVDFLCKPFSGSELIKRVEKIIGPGMHDSGDGVILLKKVLAKEINRAKRGELTFTLVLAKQLEFKSLGKQSHYDHARRMQDSLREIDLVISLNNKIIAAVLPITNVEGAGVVIGKISACHSGKLRYGIANYPDHGRDVDALLRFAEAGLTDQHQSKMPKIENQEEKKEEEKLATITSE